MAFNDKPKGEFARWLSETFYYPIWFTSENWNRVCMDSFLKRYVLHDSTLVGIWSMDDPQDVYVILDWDVSFYPDFPVVSENVYLLVRFEHLYNMRCLGGYSTNVVLNAVSLQLNPEETKVFLEGMMALHSHRGNVEPWLHYDEYLEYLAILEKDISKSSAGLFRTLLFNAGECVEFIHDDFTYVKCLDSEGNLITIPFIQEL